MPDAPHPFGGDYQRHVHAPGEKEPQDGSSSPLEKSGRSEVNSKRNEGQGNAQGSHYRQERRDLLEMHPLALIRVLCSEVDSLHGAPEVEVNLDQEWQRHVITAESLLHQLHRT